MTYELISTAVTSEETMLSQTQQKFFPSTKESLLISPTSGPTGKTVFVAQRLLWHIVLVNTQGDDLRKPLFPSHNF